MKLPELSREKLRILRSITSGRTRRRRGLCLVEGEGALHEAMGSHLLQFLVVEDGRSGSRVRSLLEGPLAGLPCYALEKALYDEVSGVRSGPGLLGVGRIPDPADLKALSGPGQTGRFLLLDSVQEPGNVGTLIRTAWGLGFTGALLGHGTADPFGRKGVRASAGGVFRLPLVERVGPEEVEALTRSGFSLFYAERGGRNYRQVPFPDRSILALGNEGAGTSEWVRQRGTAVGVPTADGVDSLNVVVAGAIIAAAMVIPGHGDTGTRGHGE